MFNANKTKEQLERINDKLLEHASNATSFQEISDILEVVEKLDKLKKSKKRFKINYDTALMVFGNLAGIGMILYHEKAGILASKALGFVLRARV